MDLLNVAITGCSAERGKGGAIYVDSMYQVFLRTPSLNSNYAREGGALYARACGSPWDHADDVAQFQGIQILDGILGNNSAYSGVSATHTQYYYLKATLSLVLNTNYTFSGRSRRIRSIASVCGAHDLP